MGRNAIIASLLGLLTVLLNPDQTRAQGPVQAAAGADNTSKVKAGDHIVSEAVNRLVEQLRRYPARPSAEARQVGLYLIDTGGGVPTLIANEPDRWLIQFAAPSWSHDGKQILFDATPGTVDLSFSRQGLTQGRPPGVAGPGPGELSHFSPSDDRTVFAQPGGTKGDGGRVVDAGRRLTASSAGRKRTTSMVAG